MLLSLRKNGLTSLFKEVRVFKEMQQLPHIAIEAEIITDFIRAKGTLISEPRFSTSCEMRFFPREKGKMAFLARVFL